MTRTGHGPLLQLMPGVRFASRSSSWHIAGTSIVSIRSNKSALRSMLAPSSIKRCVLPEKREMRWFHRPLFRELIVPELGDRYMAEYFWECTPVPASEPFRPPRLDRPPDDWRPDGFDEKSFILVNPTSGWRQKSWLPECWARMLAILRNDTDLEFVMTSASVDWQVRTLPRDSGKVWFSRAEPRQQHNVEEFSLAVLACPSGAHCRWCRLAPCARFWCEQHHPVRADECSELALCRGWQHRRPGAALEGSCLPLAKSCARGCPPGGATGAHLPHSWSV